MFELFSIALAAVVALVARGQVQAADLCQQSTEVKQILCAFISLNSNNNWDLYTLVRNKEGMIDQEVFNLQNPQNVTSIDDLYQELVKYNIIFRGFDASMKAHMSTPEYAVESAIASVSKMVTTYLRRVNWHITYIQQTTDYISENTSVASPTTTLVNVSPRRLDQIYAETNYVTSKMTALLGLWSEKCSRPC